MDDVGRSSHGFAADVVGSHSVVAVDDGRIASAVPLEVVEEVAVEDASWEVAIVAYGAAGRAGDYATEGERLAGVAESWDFLDSVAKKDSAQRIPSFVAAADQRAALADAEGGLLYAALGWVPSRPMPLFQAGTSHDHVPFVELSRVHKS